MHHSLILRRCKSLEDTDSHAGDSAWPQATWTVYESGYDASWIHTSYQTLFLCHSVSLQSKTQNEVKAQVIE